MPAINFQARFAPYVSRGLLQDAGKMIGGQAKRQTIRARRKDGRDPKPGDTLHLYTGMRTKKCRKLGEVRCKSVRSVSIGRDGEVSIDGGPLLGFEGGAATRFARSDGFADVGEMRVWFERVHGLPFEGLVVRW